MAKFVLSYKKLLILVTLFAMILGTVFGFYLPTSFAKSNGDLPDTPSIQPSGCSMLFCVEWVPSHYDSTCLEIVQWTAPVACAAACGGLIENPVVYAACFSTCINAAEWGCYVPSYYSTYEERWLSPCPE